jgi:hypothetical protein
MLSLAPNGRSEAKPEKNLSQIFLGLSRHSQMLQVRKSASQILSPLCVTDPVDMAHFTPGLHL